MAEKNLLEAIREALYEEMGRDERVVVMGEDVGVAGGVFGATRGLYESFGAARVIDTPLAESGIVGIGIGAAANGLRPVVEIQFADYIHPAMDQIMNEAAKLRYRTNGDWGCPLVIRAPFGAGIQGGLYHSQSVEALFYHVPGLKIVIPSTPADAKGLLKAAIRDEDPVLFFEHKKGYRSLKGDVPDGDVTVPIGKARVRRDGSDLTVLTYGLMVEYALTAAERLADDGVSVEVVDLRSIAPLDKEAILTSAAKTGRVMIVHEDTKTGGVGAEVAAIIAEESLFSLDAPIRRVTAPDTPGMPFNSALENAFLPNPERIEAGLRELAAY